MSEPVSRGSLGQFYALQHGIDAAQIVQLVARWAASAGAGMLTQDDVDARCTIQRREGRLRPRTGPKGIGGMAHTVTGIRSIGRGAVLRMAESITAAGAEMTVTGKTVTGKESTEMTVTGKTVIGIQSNALIEALMGGISRSGKIGLVVVGKVAHMMVTEGPGGN